MLPFGELFAPPREIIHRYASASLFFGRVVPDPL